MIKIDQLNAVVPTNDYVFKRIFGHVGNEIITKGFLNSILNEEIESVNLEGNTILEKDLMDDKFGILDIKAKLNDEIICNIEMQIVNYNNIDKRLMFYWSKMYSSNLKSGEDYEKLKKTIIILVADFEFQKFKQIQKGHTEWKLREKEFSTYILTDVCEIHIIELPKLEKAVENNKLTIKEQTLSNWVKFLLNPNEMEGIDMESNESLKKAKEEFDEIQNDEYEQRMAFSRLIHQMDCKAIENTGYDKGLHQGEKQSAKKIAKKMLKKGKSVEEIMELTELTKEEIKELQK